VEPAALSEGEPFCEGRSLAGVWLRILPMSLSGFGKWGKHERTAGRTVAIGDEGFAVDRVKIVTLEQRKCRSGSGV